MEASSTGGPERTPQKEAPAPSASAPGVAWPHFGRLWLASAVSALGDGVRNTALPLLALSFTDNPVLLSLTTIVTALGMMMAPIGGVWADIFDRRVLLIAIDLARFVVVALIAVGVVTDSLNLLFVYIAAAVLGMGESVFLVTAQAFLPKVVTPDRLTTSNGRLHAVQVVLRDSVGQPLGGVLFAFAAAAPFILDGVSFLLGVLLLLFPVLRTARTDPAGPRTSWWQMIREGMRYLREDRLLIRLAVILGTLNFFTMSLGVLMVLYVVQWLDLPESAYGFFLAANALGGVVGGLSSDWVRRRIGVLPGALTALAVMGVACLLLGGTRTPAVAAISFGAVGFGIATWQTLITAFRQATIPQDILGRVNGVFRLLSVCVSPFGAITAGVVAQFTEINVPMLVSGVGILALTAISARPLLRLGAAQAVR
ncbi:MFS transporter [Streptomyces sp. NRRL S-920]|uniref:MFS transporter n=1 Tax=Streptomyces sp. NRRL S-920 TaxID=1463921 RepID=UPI000997F36E|nr:MFS transporter [Streptomyces sp. NRRL S-920]